MASQDAGIGRNTSLPCTTKRRITTNLKTIKNQNCQKIKLHGTLTTKKLKETLIQTSRRSGDRQRTEKTSGKAAGGLGQERQRLVEWKTKDSEPLAVKYHGDCEDGRNSQSHRRIGWKVELEGSQPAALFPH